MKEYVDIANFNYKNNTYKMLLDSNNKHFFLKVDNEGNLSYLSLFELLEISEHMLSIPLVLKIENNNVTKKKKLHVIPKVLIGTSLVTLNSFILLVGIANYKSKKRLEEFDNNYVPKTREERLAEYVSTDYIEENVYDKRKEEFENDTYFEGLDGKTIYIYDMKYLDNYLDYDSVSKEELLSAISSNGNIPSKYKDFINKYIDDLTSKYPNADLRCFYENLKTLQIEECTKEEMTKKTISLDSQGCYVLNENKIYVFKDIELEEGTWNYQVMYHELSHAVRGGIFEKDGKTIKVSSYGTNYNNTMTDESLNSVFAVSLFDYEERDIAYQFQSNITNVLVNSMDNYKLEDYINHPQSYFVKKLDEFNGDDNYAASMLEMHQLLYDDFHSDYLNVRQEDYYPLYDYISSTYYKNKVNENTTYQDMNQMTDELVDKLTFDVPDEYKVDVDHFYDYMKEYSEEKGIKAKTK